VFNADGTPFNATGFVSSFFAFNTSVGVLSLAAGDVNGDGRADIIVGSGAGTRGKIRVFSGVNSSLIGAFNAFAAGSTSGANVGLADRNGDNRFDIRVTPRAGASSRIFNFDFLGNPLGTNVAFNGFQGGTFIAGARS
jgi:serralysin